MDEGGDHEQYADSKLSQGIAARDMKAATTRLTP